MRSEHSFSNFSSYLLVEIVYFSDKKFVAEVRIIDFELCMPEGVCGVINLSSNDLLG